ncbi:MAG: di-trans,poly-cis-decaprenylcistransferase [Opitutales bacterium]|nr:di-trans,poly-cis-decaprenylcistransferase [Opitutales bacterium]
MTKESGSASDEELGFEPGSVRHVAIIMDGNGRWARARGLPRNEGHRNGVRNVQEIVKAARQADLRHLTLFAFSVENWHRPKAEVSALMHLLDSYLTAQADELKRQEIRLRVIGRLEELPRRVSRRIQRLMEETAHFDRWNLNLALNYGSRTEVVDAMRAYAQAVQAGLEDPEALDWATAVRFLYTRDLPDPDLIIRTSGEHRVSNFLLLQGAYAEYHFTDKFWPEFEPADFFAALAEFARRERRFGQTSEQLKSPRSPSSLRA